MHRTIRHIRFCRSLAFGVLLAIHPTPTVVCAGQDELRPVNHPGLVPLPDTLSPASASPAAVTDEVSNGFFEDGESLERSRLWGDAIRHYEAGLRQWENDQRLSQRLLICRLHFDVQRRYEDRSFTKSVSELSTEQTLDLYAEVLSNLETYYVESPVWSEIQRYGTASLEVALTEPGFIDQHLRGFEPNLIEHFRQNVHRYVSQRPRATRFDLRATASFVATLAHEKIGLSPTATVFEYICGAVSTLDPYSRFLTANQLTDTFSNIEGNFVGLGVELKASPDALQIISVIPGGSAEQAGLAAGDAIVAVAGTATRNNDPDKVADLLRGPEHTFVAVDVRRRDGTELSLQVERRRVEVPSVENVKIIDSAGKIGYFRLTNFQKTTSRDVEKALWNLHRQGMKKLIVDLRGNPGGLLTSAIEIADRFLDRGRIVLTRGRFASDNRDYFAHTPNTWNVPLIVLIDGDSASASEILAGAIRDSQRGILVGQRTYGKGSVQGIFSMHAAPVGLSLTTAKFFSPSNTEISRRGVSPHVSVQPTYIQARPTENGEIATIEDDAILSAALRAARDESRLSLLP